MIEQNWEKIGSAVFKHCASVLCSQPKIWRKIPKNKPMHQSNKQCIWSPQKNIHRQLKPFSNYWCKSVWIAMLYEVEPLNQCTMQPQRTIGSWKVFKSNCLVLAHFWPRVLSVWSHLVPQIYIESETAPKYSSKYLIWNNWSSWKWGPWWNSG